ncbi:hypothetical protein ACMAWB_27250, partial [Klebsiella pneumoniae]
KIGPDPRNFNQRVSLGRNDLLIRTFHKRSAIRNKCQVLHAEVAWWNQRGKGVELLHHLFPEQHNNNPRFETSALF